MSSNFDEDQKTSNGSPKARKNSEQASASPLASSSEVTKSRLPVLLGGTALAVFGLLGGGGYLLYKSRTVDNGVGNLAQVASAPNVKNDSMAPVGAAEADRRATLNDELANEAAEKGDSHVAKTVIAEKYQVGDERDPYTDELAAAKKPEATEAPKPEVQVVEKIVYRDPPQTDPVIDPDTLGRIQSQINYAQKPPQSRFVAMTFRKPEPAQPKQAANAGAATAGTGAVANVGPNAMAGQQAAQMIAKPGDIFYGSLWIGFNSDDPRGAPVYATIYDNRADGTRGPLHGARLEGQVAYSDNNAALQFTRIILADGKIIPASALAVDERNARLGIAQNVDFHTFQRYSSLLVSSLIEGIGTAANTMLTNNRTVTFLPDTNTIVSQSNNNDEWTKAGLAALQPLGSALSSASRQGFNRRPTISANRGHRVGIVFTSEVLM